MLGRLPSSPKVLSHLPLPGIPIRLQISGGRRGFAPSLSIWLLKPTVSVIEESQIAASHLSSAYAELLSSQESASRTGVN